MTYSKYRLAALVAGDFQALFLTSTATWRSSAGRAHSTLAGSGATDPDAQSVHDPFSRCVRLWSPAESGFRLKRGVRTPHFRGVEAGLRPYTHTVGWKPYIPTEPSNSALKRKHFDTSFRLREQKGRVSSSFHDKGAP